MSAEQDYCQYIISKCKFRGAKLATEGVFLTTKAFLNAYEGSSSFFIGARERDRRIIDWTADVIEKENQNTIDLNADTKDFLSRCRCRIDMVKTYEEMFTVLADFLWIMASRKAAGGRIVSLTDDVLIERKYASAWISEWNQEIKDAQYDLECMNEADNLPLGKQIFQGFISNRDVAKYVNREYISYEDFKQRIADCRLYIEKKQLLYYSFTATVIYREDLSRRYP